MTKIASKTYISILLGEKTPNQCRIQGRASTLFIEQTEARRAEKKKLRLPTPPPPLPYLRVWMIGAPLDLFWRSGSAADNHKIISEFKRRENFPWNCIFLENSQKSSFHFVVVPTGILFLKEECSLKFREVLDWRFLFVSFALFCLIFRLAL